MTRILVSIGLGKFCKYFRGIAIGLVLNGCVSTQKVQQKITLAVPEENLEQERPSSNQTKLSAWSYVFDDHNYINLPEVEKSLKAIGTLDTLVQADDAPPADATPKSLVAQRIVENYIKSENKEPNGHCLTVSKTRFEKAYKEIHGHSVYQDLPDYMGTKRYTPKQVYNLLYVSASDTKRGWRSLPEAYRGKGNAGAVAYAGMGTLVDTKGVWAGELQPGALMQVWRFKEDYEKVVKGADVKKLDPYGHSFIFIAYVRNEKNEIEGLKIADQGFQSYRPLVPRDYEVWWGVNLNI
ncbi:hypothetical protein PP182_07270 [Maribacter sp. PR1]|uniref:Uncharacterized protein n=1 Tax=Maribacter cobaltidurans TaxID=1178778 RepID=A0ABU7ISC2_9FLAO|nr:MULTISPECIES: hypothetical protein [Maribacter]MDC6388476.1 hypothetical protein [Maribacter sp. PR1]MEE1975865.1 hypothetical protein [Maribacter cobaltidurans]